MLILQLNLQMLRYPVFLIGPSVVKSTSPFYKNVIILELPIFKVIPNASAALDT